MSKNITKDYNYTLRVIKSCKNLEHRMVAKNLVSNFHKKYIRNKNIESLLNELKLELNYGN